MRSRVTSHRVRALAVSVAAERKVAVDDIFSASKAGPIVTARRIAMRRAMDAGASSILVAKVFGCASSSVRNMMARNGVLANDDLHGISADERKTLAAPFMRARGGTSPLTLDDYACRAGLCEAEALAALNRLITAGLVRKTKLAAKGYLAIYEWTEDAA